MTEHWDTILTALYERKARLVQLDMESGVHTAAVPKLRARITECNRAIRAIVNAKGQASA